jgi:predicted DNA-binding protein (UPF0251 family)
MALSGSGGRTIEASLFFSIKNEEAIEHDFATYIKAKRFGLRSIPMPPRWLERSLKADWMEGNIVARNPSLNLSEREWECLGRHFFGGERQADLARSLGLSKKTVHEYLQRGVKKIRRFIRSTSGGE